MTQPSVPPQEQSGWSVRVEKANTAVSWVTERRGCGESTDSSGEGQLQGEAEQRASCYRETWAVERGTESRVYLSASHVTQEKGETQDNGAGTTKGTSL